MTARVIKKNEYVVHGWSGGTTAEIFCFPPSSSWERKDFEIRISSADCRLDGAPYSDFTGYTRHITPLKGRMHMVHKNHHSVQLEPYDIDIFDGSWQTHHTGLAIDFNLLHTKNWNGKMYAVDAHDTVKVAAETIAGFYAVRDLTVKVDQDDFCVKEGDFLLLEPASQARTVHLKAQTKGTCAMGVEATHKEKPSMMLHQTPLDHFCAITASNAPAPGGGSVSALCGALAASLSAMVGNLTIGRKVDEEHEEAIQQAVAELGEIRERLLRSIDEDSASFNEFMVALKMPKVTDEEKALRKDAMQAGLKKASSVPLAVARESVKIFSYAQLMIEFGNPNALTDAMVSTLAARTATLGALLNVRINLGSIKDTEFIKTTLREVQSLEAEANHAESKLLQKGYFLLNK